MLRRWVAENVVALASLSIAAAPMRSALAAEDRNRHPDRIAGLDHSQALGRGDKARQ